MASQINGIFIKCVCVGGGYYKISFLVNKQTEKGWYLN